MNFERPNLDVWFVAHAKWRRVSQNRHSCQFADKWGGWKGLLWRKRFCSAREV